MAEEQLFIVRHGRKVLARSVWVRPFTRIIKWPSSAEITIIVPLFERREIGRCLHQLLRALAFARLNAHLIVVDQTMSVDLRYWVIEQLQLAAAHRNVGAVVYHFDSTLTIATAKNKGAQLAEILLGPMLSDLLIFLDSDVYMSSGTLASLQKAARRYSHIAAFGFPSVWMRHATQAKDTFWPPYFHMVPTNLRNKPEQLILASGKTSWDGFFLEVPAIHGCLFAIRTRIYQKEGGFHPFFGMHGEYVELCARLRDQGYRLGYILHPLLLHDDRPTVQYSVTRNLPHRERFLLATIVVMAARNHAYQPDASEERFVELIKQKWLDGIRIQVQNIDQTHRYVLELASLLHQTLDSRDEFEHRARVWAQGVRPDYVRRYFRETILHLSLNFEELALFLRSASPVLPLYGII